MTNPAWRGILVILAGLALCLPTTSAAQVTTAVCGGRVVDAGGAPLQGVAITALQPGTGLARGARTDASGLYRIGTLPAGLYEIRAELAGFATQRRTGVTLRVGQEARLDLTLTLAPREETVTVTGETSIVETTRSSIGKTITTGQIDELPVSGRNFVNLAFLAPGVLQASAEATPLSASGANGSSNTFLVDGMSYDENGLSGLRGNLSLDAIQEFQVLTGQYAAEFGQASGVIVNVITRSGTNSVRGRAFGFYRADELAANSPLAPTNAATGKKTEAPFSQWTFGGSLGGPLVRDKAFYFLSYEHLLREDTAVITVPESVLSALELPTQTTYARPTRNLGLLGRLDYRPSGNHTLSLRARVSGNRVENGGFGGISVRERGGVSQNDFRDIGASHTWTLSPSVVNDLRVQLARAAFDLIPYCEDCPDLRRPSVLYGKPFGLPQDRTEDRVQVADQVSVAIPGMAGDHNLKAGFDVSFIEIPSYVEQYHDGFFNFVTDRPFDPADRSTYPVIFIQGYGDPNGQDHNTIVAAFVQDQWRVTRRLTLNLGLRFDTDSGNYVNHDRDNFAPRLHAAFDVTGDGKTLVRGGYARAYDQTFVNIPATVANLGGKMYQRQIVNPGYPDPTQGGVALPAAPPTIWVNDVTLGLPYADTLGIGVQRELFANLAVSVDFTRAWGRRLFRRTDFNYTVDGSPRPDPAFAQKPAFESEGHGDYRAMILYLERRFARGFGLSLAYTLADTKKDTESHQFQPVDVRFPEAEYAPSTADARHTLAGHVNWDGPWGLKLGLAGRYRSALPYTITTGRDDNRDGTFNDRPAGVARSSARGSAVWTLDTRLSKVVRLGKARVEAIAEAFNLLNHSNLWGYVGAQNSASFGKPTSTAFDARQVQLGLRLDF